MINHDILKNTLTGFDKKYLSEDINCSYISVCNWFSGKIIPKEKRIKQIAKVLRYDWRILQSFFINKHKEYIEIQHNKVIVK